MVCTNIKTSVFSIKSEPKWPTKDWLGNKKQPHETTKKKQPTRKPKPACYFIQVLSSVLLLYPREYARFVHRVIKTCSWCKEVPWKCTMVLVQSVISIIFNITFSSTYPFQPTHPSQNYKVGITTVHAAPISVAIVLAFSKSHPETWPQPRWKTSWVIKQDRQRTMLLSHAAREN